MLVTGSSFIGMPILSLHVGGEVAYVKDTVIDPEDLNIIAFELEGGETEDPEVGKILMVRDIREFSENGIIVNSTDVFAFKGEVVHLDEVMELDFHLVGLKVVTKKKEKIGKIADYTVDGGSFMIYQLIVDRPLLKSFLDPQLTINRSQITEVDDYKVTINHEKSKVKIEQAQEEFVPNFVNPFRKQDYAGSEAESNIESSSDMSE